MRCFRIVRDQINQEKSRNSKPDHDMSGKMPSNQENSGKVSEKYLYTSKFIFTRN